VWRRNDTARSRLRSIEGSRLKGEEKRLPRANLARGKEIKTKKSL
jgi:hypothetical protein